MNERANQALLRQLCFASGLHSIGSLAFVVAHPDDEVIGAGAQLPRWGTAQFIHVTDGAPRDLRDAGAAGFSRRCDYALARRRDLESALTLAGLGASPLRQLGVADQEASLNLVGLARALCDLLLEIRPEAVLTHPYEGGHPDHDATAFAVQAACNLLQKQDCHPPVLVEMTSYHAQDGGLESSRFLPCPDRRVVTIPLTESQREFKQRLFRCFRTQQRVLAAFGFERECFRLAPRYDFTKPPHPGVLYYEQFDWGMTGRRWRALAGVALAELELVGCSRQSPN